MRTLHLTATTALALASAAFLAGCGQGGHDHAGEHGEHSHEEHGEHAADHEHEKSVPGPNGGRVITSIEPHLEFLVTGDRRARITALDDDLKPIAITSQTVTAIAGDRAAPTRLAFAADGTTLLSDVALPEGGNFPIVLSIKAQPDSEIVREKFNVSLSDCPTCDFKEYACICGHEDEGGHDHDHEKEKAKDRE